MSFFKKIFGADEALTVEKLQKMSPDDVRKKFFTAIKGNDQHSAGLIMDHHPDAMQWGVSKSWVDNSVTTPFLAAMKAGQYEMIAFLVSKGADIDAPVFELENFPERLINRAISEADLPLVNLLVELGADLTSYANTRSWQTVRDIPQFIRDRVYTPVEQAQALSLASASIEKKNTFIQIKGVLEKAIGANHAATMSAAITDAPADDRLQRAFFAAVNGGKANVVDMMLDKYPQASHWTLNDMSGFDIALALSADAGATAAPETFLQIADNIARVAKTTPKPKGNPSFLL